MNNNLKLKTMGLILWILLIILFAANLFGSGWLLITIFVASIILGIIIGLTNKPTIPEDLQ